MPAVLINRLRLLEIKIQYDSFAQAYLLKTETQEIQINPMIAQQIYVEKL